jgi:hypothetical protein
MKAKSSRADSDEIVRAAGMIRPRSAMLPMLCRAR